MGPVLPSWNENGIEVVEGIYRNSKAGKGRIRPWRCSLSGGCNLVTGSSLHEPHDGCQTAFEALRSPLSQGSPPILSIFACRFACWRPRLLIPLHRARHGDQAAMSAIRREWFCCPWFLAVPVAALPDQSPKQVLKKLNS